MGETKLTFDFDFKIGNLFLKIITPNKKIEKIPILDGCVTVPYNDFFYRFIVDEKDWKESGFCFPADGHGVQLIENIPWASTKLKSSNSKVIIDNIQISNTFHNNFRFPYEKRNFYKGSDNMISTLCDIRNLSKPEVFTLIFTNLKDITAFAESLVIPDKNHKKFRKFAAFEFDSFQLKGGEKYLLEYVLSGKLIEKRSIRFEEGTYDFSRKIL